MIVAVQRLARRPTTMMRLWACASLAWLAAVASLAWEQIEDQVEAGREVARDVAVLDCEGTAAAIAKCLAKAEAAAGVSWGDIAAVAWEYEPITIAAWFFLPPRVSREETRIAPAHRARWRGSLAASSSARPAAR